MFYLAGCSVVASRVVHGWGEVYPGYGMTVGGLEGYTGTHPVTLQDPIFSISEVKPYPRPNEGLFGSHDEVSEIGSRKGPRMPQI